MKYWNSRRFSEARILHADHHLGDQVLEHPRRREVIGRADLAQVGHHRGRRFRAVHAPGRRRSPGRRRRCARRPTPSAGRTSTSSPSLRPSNAAPALAAHDEIVVAQHRALGPAGRARGVEHDGVVAAAPLGDLGRHQVRASPRAAWRRAPAPRRRTAARRSAAARADRRRSRRSSGGTLLLDLQQLVDLLLVLGERETRAGMLDDIGQLVGRPNPGRPAPARRPATAPRTSTSRAAAGCRRSRSAGRRGRNPRSARPAASRLDLPGDMGPVVGLPDAVFLFAVGRPVGPGAGARRQKLGKRVPSLARRIGRSRRHPLAPRSLDPPFVC